MTIQEDADKLVVSFYMLRKRPMLTFRRDVKLAKKCAIKHCELMLTELGKLTDGNIDATLSYRYYANLLDELKQL